MNGQLQYNRGLTEPRLPRSALAVRVTAVMLLCFLGWRGTSSLMKSPPAAAR